MMRTLAWVFGLGSLGYGLVGLNSGSKIEAVTTSRPPLGVSLDTKSVFNGRKIRLGDMMFSSNWRADVGALFNEKNCLNCHDHPTTGGINRRPGKDVFMIPDPHQIGGWSNFRRNKQVSESNGGDGYQGILRPENSVRRKSLPLFGLGLIDAIPLAAIKAKADPLDKNNDGISGRMLEVSKGEWGRFGWKLNSPNLKVFVQEAFEIELGVKGFDPKSHPIGTIDNNQIDATIWFIKMLAPPEPDPKILEMERGKALFNSINCSSCHTPTWKTGKQSEPALSEKSISPYSDLLLHQMGSGPLHLANGQIAEREVRTPLLWGIGAIGGPFLHDKSASTIEEAIEKGHLGEGEKSRQAFLNLTPKDRNFLVEFVKAL